MYWKTALMYSGIGFMQLMLLLSTGIFILQTLKIKLSMQWKFLFYALCIGQYVWAISAALYYTQAKTVLAGSLPLIVLALVITKISSSTELTSYQPKTYKKLIKSLLLLPIIWAWTSILNFYCISLKGNSLYLPHFDILHSIKISLHLQKTGIETYYHWQNTSFLFPYHYIEIWLHAAIQTFWNLQPTWLAMQVLIPILQLTLIVGLLALLEQYQKKVDVFWFILACGFITFQGWLNFSLPYYDTQFSFTRYSSMIGVPKFMVIGTVALLFILISSKLRWIVFSLLPIFSILTFPIAIFLMLAEFVRNQNKLALICAAWTTIWILTFYFFTAEPNLSNDNFTYFFPTLNNKFIYMQGYFLCFVFFFYLPTFLGLKQDRESMFVLCTTAVVGYVLQVMFYRWYDSYQFLFLLLLPFLWSYSWLVAIRSQLRQVKVVLCCVLLVALFQSLWYKRDFQRTAVDNHWIDEIYAYLSTLDILDKGAAVWYYDTRQTDLFCWKDKPVRIIPLLATNIYFDRNTNPKDYDVVTEQIIQTKVPFRYSHQSSLEEQILHFCQVNQVRFLVYPNKYFFAQSAKMNKVLRRFENTKDSLSCVVLDWR